MIKPNAYSSNNHNFILRGDNGVFINYCQETFAKGSKF